MSCRSFLLIMNKKEMRGKKKISSTKLPKTSIECNSICTTLLLQQRKAGNACSHPLGPRLVIMIMQWLFFILSICTVVLVYTVFLTNDFSLHQFIEVFPSFNKFFIFLVSCGAIIFHYSSIYQFVQLSPNCGYLLCFQCSVTLKKVAINILS